MLKFKKIKNNQTDEQLFEAFKSGDENAFEELYIRYSKNLLFYLYKMLHGDKHKAEDFLHDIFLKLIYNPKLFNTTKNFKVWIYSVAYNKCKNEYRMQEKRNTISTDFEDINLEIMPKDTIDFNLFIESLNEELNNMSFENKSIFLLRHKYNYSIKEISKTMNCQEGTVKSRLFYTILKLSKKLKCFNPYLEEK